MRTLLLISAATVGLAFAAPAASAMPAAPAGVSKVMTGDSYVTEVRMKKRWHKRHRVMRSRTPDNLDRGLPGFGPARDMSKTNGGRANDR